MLIPMTVKFELWENPNENDLPEGVKRELGEVSMLLDSEELPEPERLLEGLRSSKKLRLLRKMLDRYIQETEELEREVMEQDSMEDIIQEIDETMEREIETGPTVYEVNGEVVQDVEEMMMWEMDELMTTNIEEVNIPEHTFQDNVVEISDKEVVDQGNIDENLRQKEGTGDTSEKRNQNKYRASDSLKRPYLDGEAREDNRGSKRNKSEEESKETKRKKRRETEVRRFCEELMVDRRQEEEVTLMVNNQETEGSIDKLACWYEREEKNNTNGLWEWYSAGKELTEEIMRRIDQGEDEWISKRRIYEEVREKLAKWGYTRNQSTISNKLMRTRKVYGLFEEVGVDRIHNCASHSADWISRLSNGEIEEVKSYILKDVDGEHKMRH
jgi:hypothetical protein